MLFICVCGLFQGHFLTEEKTSIQPVLQHIFRLNILLFQPPADKTADNNIENYVYYLYANDHQYALQSVRKTALFFYVAAGGSTHNDYPKSTEPFDLDFSADQVNEVFLVHRNRPDIAKVEWELAEDSRKVLLDQWKDDFAMIVLPRSGADSVFWQGTVRAYDAQGKLVDERVFP